MGRDITDMKPSRHGEAESTCGEYRWKTPEPQQRWTPPDAQVCGCFSAGERSQSYAKQLAEVVLAVAHRDGVWMRPVVEKSDMHFCKTLGQNNGKPIQGAGTISRSEVEKSVLGEIE